VLVKTDDHWKAGTKLGTFYLSIFNKSGTRDCSIV
jgi:hypothetical protein